jgi:hypothetical protein
MSDDPFKPESIMQKYERKFREEFNASAGLPKIAVLGHDDFDELAGAMMTFYGMELKEGSSKLIKTVGHFELQGVQLFRCCAMARGMMFAAKEGQS